MKTEAGDLHVFLIETAFGSMMADVLRQGILKSHIQGSEFQLYSFYEDFEYLSNWDKTVFLGEPVAKRRKYDLSFFSRRLRRLRPQAQELRSTIDACVRARKPVNIYLQTIHKFLPNHLFFTYCGEEWVRFHLLQDGIGNYLFDRSALQDALYRLQCVVFGKLHGFRYQFYHGNIFGMHRSEMRKIFMLYSQDLIERKHLERRFGAKFEIIQKAFELYLQQRLLDLGTLPEPEGDAVLFIGQEPYIFLWSSEEYLTYLQNAMRFLVGNRGRQIKYLLAPGFRVASHQSLFDRVRQTVSDAGGEIEFIENTFAPIELGISRLAAEHGFTEIYGYNSSALLSLATLYQGRFLVRSIPSDQTRAAVGINDFGVEEIRI